MALAARNAGRAAKGAPKDQARKSGPQFSKDEELHAYREMLLIRRFEEKAGQMYGMGLIGGFCHLTSARKRSSSACRWHRRRAIR